MARKIPFRRPRGYAADVSEAFRTVSLRLSEKSESALAWGPARGKRRDEEASLSLVRPTEGAPLAPYRDLSDSLRGGLLGNSRLPAYGVLGSHKRT